MTVKSIKREKDYYLAIESLEKLFDAKKGSSEGASMEVLSILIEKYEDEHFPVKLPDPIEATKFRMEQLGYNQVGNR